MQDDNSYSSAGDKQNQMEDENTTLTPEVELSEIEVDTPVQLDTNNNELPGKIFLTLLWL